MFPFAACWRRLRSCGLRHNCTPATRFSSKSPANPARNRSESIHGQPHHVVFAIRRNPVMPRARHVLRGKRDCSPRPAESHRILRLWPCRCYTHTKLRTGTASQYLPYSGSCLTAVVGAGTGPDTVPGRGILPCVAQEYDDSNSCYTKSTILINCIRERRER